MLHLLSIALPILAAPLPVQDRPAGIFCSCGPTSSAGASSHTAAIAALPFVDGFLVRVPWSDVEPSPGTYDWSLVDQQLALIAADGMLAALSIVQGDSGTPSWLAGLGAQMVTYPFFGTERTVALAWDAIYLERWTALVAALGARYADNPTIEVVHATHATHNGFEMQLPFGEQTQYQSLGYTDALYAESWAVVLDAFATAFPNTWLDVDVHPIWGSDVPAQLTTDHGLTTIGDRFGVFGAWWSVKNAVDVYPGMYELFLQAAPQTFATVQNVGSWISTPERYDFDLDAYTASYSLAIASGVRYFEVWNADLLAAELTSLLVDIAAETHCDGWWMEYGAGSAGAGSITPTLTLSGCPAPDDAVTLELTDALGGTPAWIGLGSSRSELPLLGGTVWIGPSTGLAFLPLVTSGSGPGTGSWTLPWSIPAGALGTITSQAIVLDGAAPEGVALSNALELRLG